MHYICSMMLNIQRHPTPHEEVAGGPGNPAGPQNKYGFYAIVDNVTLQFSEPDPTGTQILEKAGKRPLSCFSLFIKLKGCDFEQISPDQKVDLKNPVLEHFVTKDPDVYPYSVNQDPELTKEKMLTARMILTNAALDPAKLYLVLKEEGEEEHSYAFTADEPIRMHCRGLHFITREWLDTVDIEEYGKICKLVPPAHHYLIKVDKEKFKWDHPTIKAEELIGFIVKDDNPAKYNLIKFYGNNPKPVPVPFTAVVDLTEKCLLRFVVQPKTQNDGEGERRNFSLPESDTDFLNEMGFRWEALSENQYNWLLIHDHSLPDGYQVKSCTVALMIPPSYPALEIDMAYFFPELIKTSGRAISATSQQPIDAIIFQRWSRHRQAGDWKPGVDNVATHLTLVDNWLENDINR